MANTITAVEIVNQALVLLGAEPINSLADESAEANTANTLYPTCKAELLVRCPWRFAIKQATLARSTFTPTDAKGVEQWDFAYRMPADMLRMRSVRGRPPYEIYGDLLYTNVDQVLIDYWRDCEEAELPPDFVKALANRLAADMAVSITEDRTRAEHYAVIAEDLIKRAITTDLQARPEEPANNATLLQVRFGGDSSVNNDGTWR